jgi:hypothetical protein
MLTTQMMLQKKQFGNLLSSTRPVEYRREEWMALGKGRERAIRLMTRAMLGVPSVHVGDAEHPMWCFQFPKGSILVVHLPRGTVIELAARPDDEKEIEEAVDLLVTEMSAKVKEL